MMKTDPPGFPSGAEGPAPLSVVAGAGIIREVEGLLGTFRSVVGAGHGPNVADPSVEPTVPNNNGSTTTTSVSHSLPPRSPNPPLPTNLPPTPDPASASASIPPSGSPTVTLSIDDLHRLDEQSSLYPVGDLSPVIYCHFDNVGIRLPAGTFIRGFSDVALWKVGDHGRKFRYGKVGGMTINENCFGVLISGSVGKAILGNNFEAPLFSAVQNFFEALQTFVDGDLFGAQVVWLENGVTVKLDHPVSEYLVLWGELWLSLDQSPFQAQRRGTPLQTVLYVHEPESFQGYNKIDEAPVHRGVVPPWWIGTNAFRAEYTARCELAKIFGRTIFVRDLCDPAFQKRLDDMTFVLYTGVPKVRVPRAFGENVFTPANMLWSLAALCVHLVGLVIIQNLLLARRPFVQPHNFRRMWDRLTEVASSPLYSDKHPLTDELTQKLKAALNQGSAVEPAEDHLPGGPS